MTLVAQVLPVSHGRGGQGQAARLLCPGHVCHPQRGAPPRSPAAAAGPPATATLSSDELEFQYLNEIMSSRRGR